MIKAIFLDLDGTLLNNEKNITEGNTKAIYKALEKGHKVIIATGRPLLSAIIQANKLGLNTEGCFLIAFNGGMLYDTYNKKVIYKKAISSDLVKQLFKEANKHDMHIQTYDDTYVLVEPRNDNAIVRKYCMYIGMEHKLFDVDQCEDAVKCLAIEPERLDVLDEYMDWVNSTYSDELNAFHSNRTYVEIVAKGLDKGEALKQMASLLNIPIENTIACGDEENDLAMIKAAGVGVAMKNGIPSVKAVADYITENDNNNDGIAEVIEKFMLN